MVQYRRLFEARGVMLISQVLGLDDNVSVYMYVYSVLCVYSVYSVYMCVCIVYTVYTCVCV